MSEILKTGLDLVNRDLAALPPDARGAFVSTLDLSTGKITVGIVTKIGDGWAVTAAMQTRLEKVKPEGYVGVSKTW